MSAAVGGDAGTAMVPCAQRCIAILWNLQPTRLDVHAVMMWPRHGCRTSTAPVFSRYKHRAHSFRWGLHQIRATICCGRSSIDCDVSTTGSRTWRLKSGRSKTHTEGPRRICISRPLLRTPGRLTGLLERQCTMSTPCRRGSMVRDRWAIAYCPKAIACDPEDRARVNIFQTVPHMKLVRLTCPAAKL